MVEMIKINQANCAKHTNMKNVLLLSFASIIIALLYSLCRFGLVMDGFMRGDGSAALEAGSVLIVIWALVVGFSITAIGATVQLSKLSTMLKLRILKHRLPGKIWPFLILALMSGVIPFFSILNTDTQTGIYESSVTAWLIVGFFLQLLLILSSVLAAYRTYDEMSLIPAIRDTLEKLDDKAIRKLIELDASASRDNFYEKANVYLPPMSPFTGLLKGDGLDLHEELVELITALLREKDPQVFELGIQAFAEWTKKNSLKDLDSYLQKLLVPLCFHTIRIDQDLTNPTLFKTRLFYLARLVASFLDAGAINTGQNAANQLWDIIEEQSRIVGMSNALDQAYEAIYTMLSMERKQKIADSILLHNLIRSVPALAEEKNDKGIRWIFKLVDTYKLHIEEINFKIWPDRRSLLSRALNKFKYIYVQINKISGEKMALFADTYDVRYLILEHIRSMQDSFVNKVKPELLKPDLKEKAADDFNYFNQLIDELLGVHVPQGDPKAYVIKYSSNPYI